MKANYRSWVQLMIAIIATLFGLTLVGLALFMPPRGVIDPTVLTAYGETLTFVGALIGIDYHYRERKPPDQYPRACPAAVPEDNRTEIV